MASLEAAGPEFSWLLAVVLLSLIHDPSICIVLRCEPKVAVLVYASAEISTVF